MSKISSDMPFEETFRFDWANFLSALETPENDMLKIYITNCPIGIRIMDQADEKGFTLLHHAVLKCVPGKVLTLIKLVMEI